MNQEKIKKLKAAATDCHGWSWPDRNKVDGTHQFGKRDEDGNFNEVGTIDASNYTGDYADDIKVLKFIRAAQPTIILELIALAERALLAAAPAPIQKEPAAPVAWQPSEEQFESWRSRHGLHHSHNEAFYDAASLYLDATPPALAGSQVQAAGDARKRVARAIWNLRREDEDRCDMELEDMGDQHSVWAEADAAIAAMREQP